MKERKYEYVLFFIINVSKLLLLKLNYCVIFCTKKPIMTFKIIRNKNVFKIKLEKCRSCTNKKIIVY